MKVRSQDLASLVGKGPLPPAVLLYGQEQGLLEEGVTLLRRRLFGPGTEEEDAAFDTEAFVASELDEERFYTSLTAHPFMTSHRLILLKEAESLPAPAQKSLLSYLERPSPTSMLLVLAGALEARSPLRKGFESASGLWCVAYYALEGHGLRVWLREALQGEGFSIEEEALGLLSQRLEGDSRSARQELEKLVTFMGNHRRIALEDALAVVGETAVYNVFAMVEAALAPGGTARALRILDRLLEAGEEPIMMLATVAQRLRRLAQGGALLRQGLDGKQVCERLRIFWKEQEGFLAACRGADVRRLARGLLLCQEADAGLKGGSDSSRQVMEQLVMKLGSLMHPSVGRPSGGYGSAGRR